MLIKDVMAPFSSNPLPIPHAPIERKLRLLNLAIYSSKQLESQFMKHGHS